MSDIPLPSVLKPVHGTAPVVDAFSGTVASAAIKLGKNAQKATAIVYKGVGTTGVSTITVEACTASDGTGATAIPFLYSTNTSSDTFGNLTQATTSGFSTTAGSNHIYQIDVDVRDCPDGYPWVRVKAVETVDSPVLGGIMWLAYNLRFNGDGQLSVLS